MTTLIQDVQSILNPLAAGGAWYAVNTAEPPVYPYIVFQRVDSTPNVSLSGPSVRQNTRMQIDIYGKTIAALDTLQNTVDAAIQAAFPGWPTGNVPLSTQDLYDFETKSYRISMDYSIWAVN